MRRERCIFFWQGSFQSVTFESLLFSSRRKHDRVEAVLGRKFDRHRISLRGFYKRSHVFSENETTNFQGNTCGVPPVASKTAACLCLFEYPHSEPSGSKASF
ncbi:hypothetical protein MRX96_040276 [Rhipicephalus microplus]